MTSGWTCLCRTNRCVEFLKQVWLLKVVYASLCWVLYSFKFLFRKGSEKDEKSKSERNKRSGSSTSNSALQMPTSRSLLRPKYPYRCMDSVDYLASMQSCAARSNHFLLNYLSTSRVSIICQPLACPWGQRLSDVSKFSVRRIRSGLKLFLEFQGCKWSLHVVQLANP